MAMRGEDIAAMICEAMPDAQVEMIDLAGDNNHWKAVIVSKAFEGINRVRQHQMVYAALKGTQTANYTPSPLKRERLKRTTAFRCPNSNHTCRFVRFHMNISQI